MHVTGPDTAANYKTWSSHSISRPTRP